MGKYWYQDEQNKWRQGNDSDDFAVSIIIGILMGLGWVLWKPISWWVLKKEQPTDGKIILWVFVVVALLSLIIYLSTL